MEHNFTLNTFGSISVRLANRMIQLITFPTQDEVATSFQRHRNNGGKIVCLVEVESDPIYESRDIDNVLYEGPSKIKYFKKKLR